MTPKIALSIRQPWAWLIVHGGKDIENRTWWTSFRGDFLIHASKGMTRNEYDDAADVAYFLKVADLPKFEDLQRGGIVGIARITDCVSESKSPWFFGPKGFVIENPKPLPFFECKGSLGFFRIEYPEGGTE